ncbi:hypothetical protein RF11_02086 [Thelohanellus kitauei]|uniref:Uncharacterized protein n=1 Tax=Thelohanellus kitauei TaxID=669202 RepID=A0A0C2MH00_THEKT|nr:hypothetical protein RF11_02086 [Thelohanellus kitauei]
MFTEMDSSIFSSSRKRSIAHKSERGNVNLKSLRSLTNKTPDIVGFRNSLSLIQTWTLVVLLVASQFHTTLSQYTPYYPVAPTNPHPFSSYGGSSSPFMPPAQNVPFSSAAYGYSPGSNTPSPSSYYAPLPPTNLVGGMSSRSFTNSPGSGNFGGFSSTPPFSSPSMDPYTGSAWSGANPYQSQNIQTNQGWGVAQKNPSYSNSIGYSQAGNPYPKTTTSPQMGYYSAVNPISNIGIAGIPHLSYPNQLSQVSQASGTGFDPSYDYLKGFKHGFDASILRMQYMQLLSDSSQNFGTPSPFINSYVGTNTICDNTRQNCQPTYSSQFGQDPYLTQPYALAYGGPQQLFQPGSYIPQQNTQPFYDSSQSLMSHHENWPQTSTGQARSYTYHQPSLMNNPVPQTEHPQGYSPSNPTHYPAGYHVVTGPKQYPHA